MAREEEGPRRPSAGKLEYALVRRNASLSQSEFNRWIGLRTTLSKLPRTVAIDLSGNHLQDCGPLVSTLAQSSSESGGDSPLAVVNLANNNLTIPDAVKKWQVFGSAFPKLKAVLLFGNSFVDDMKVLTSALPPYICIISPTDLVSRAWTAWPFERSRADPAVERLIDQHCSAYKELAVTPTGVLVLRSANGPSLPSVLDSLVYGLDSDNYCECPSDLWTRIGEAQNVLPSFLKRVLEEGQRDRRFIPRQLALDVAFRCRTGVSFNKDPELASDLFEICAITPTPTDRLNPHKNNADFFTTMDALCRTRDLPAPKLGRTE